MIDNGITRNDRQVVLDPALLPLDDVPIVRAFYDTKQLVEEQELRGEPADEQLLADLATVEPWVISAARDPVARMYAKRLPERGWARQKTAGEKKYVAAARRLLGKMPGGRPFEKGNTRGSTARQDKGPQGKVVLDTTPAISPVPVAGCSASQKMLVEVPQ